MRILTGLANRALKAKAWGGARRWTLGTGRVAQTQENLLLRIVREDRGTRFGREHDFASVRSVADYRRRVPIRDYEDFAPYVEAIAAGEREVLTAGRVNRLLPTGGSTGGTKWIPHTNSLRSAFQRGIDPWLHSLFDEWPEVMSGRAYWQVTPPAGASPGQRAGLAGFEEDSQYLSSAARVLTRQVLAVPDWVGQLHSLDSFKYVTLRHLLACADLTILSVWSPTFLEALLEPMNRWRESLLRDIRDGTLEAPVELPAHLLGQFRSANEPQPKRARELERCLGTQRPFAQAWPKLAVVSCWAHASAGPLARRLMERFPGAALQPKGLIATEAIVTFPLGSSGQALAVTSHFFEFLDERGRVRLAHELEEGPTYGVIVTTQGGLHRYRLRDVVRVSGHVGDCPTLEFVGKEELIVDLVGEKLHEAFVRASVERCCADLSLRPSFSLVAPSAPARTALGYTLFIQCDEPTEIDEGIHRRLAQALDSALQQNYQYRYAREIGQLIPIEVVAIDRDVNAADRFELHCRARGQRLGRIKPVALHSGREWAVAFRSQAPVASSKSLAASMLELESRLGDS